MGMGFDVLCSDKSKLYKDLLSLGRNWKNRVNESKKEYASQSMRRFHRSGTFGKSMPA